MVRRPGLAARGSSRVSSLSHVARFEPDRTPRGRPPQRPGEEEEKARQPLGRLAGGARPRLGAPRPPRPGAGAHPARPAPGLRAALRVQAAGDEVIAKHRADLLPLLAVAAAGATMLQAAISFTLSQVLGVAAQRAITDMRKRVQAH